MHKFGSFSGLGGFAALQIAFLIGISIYTPTPVQAAPATMASPRLELSESEELPPTPAWISKVARKLRNGAGLSWNDDLDALLKMKRAEVVDFFMKDQRFIDTVLDFNLYFLGFKPTQILSTGPERYHVSAYMFPQAITAAKAVASGGDYLKLFDLRQPNYLAPFSEPPIPPGIGDGQNQSLSREEKRALLSKSVGGSIERIRSAFGSGPAFNKDEGCRAFISGETFQFLFPASSSLSGQPSNDPGLNQFATRLFSACTSSFLGEEFIIESLDSFQKSVFGLSEIISIFDDRNYQINSVSDIRSVDGAEKSGLGNDFWALRTNSSTNFNRKRAAAILKTYFCDDLTPINIVPTDVHGSDQHGSDPSCQACHYKLDPMAGFFRNQGLAGIGFDHKETLVFDDLAAASGPSYEAYLDSWKNPERTSWNVGYIRSLREPSLNSYELNHDAPLDELFRIIREAPEVRQCLAKRMSEFFVSKDQVFDGAFMEGLSASFSHPSQSSADGFKQVVKTLILSKTFSMDNPNPKLCYDPPGTESKGALCEVSFIIENRCSSCHAEGFNISDVRVQDKMLDRLQSTDPDRRMPLRMDMPDTERVALIKWLSQDSQP